MNRAQTSLEAKAKALLADTDPLLAVVTGIGAKLALIIMVAGFDGNRDGMAMTLPTDWRPGQY